MDWSDLAPLLTGYAHIATVTPDGRPHIAKVSPIVEGDIVWVASNLSSRKVQNLLRNPDAALMFEPAGEIYLQATATVITDLATKQRLWDSGLFAFPMAAFFGSADNEDFVVLRLEPVRAIAITQGESGLRRDVWRR